MSEGSLEIISSLVSALVSHDQTSFGGETSGSVGKCRLLSQARTGLVKNILLLPRPISLVDKMNFL